MIAVFRWRVGNNITRTHGARDTSLALSRATRGPCIRAAGGRAPPRGRPECAHRPSPTTAPSLGLWRSGAKHRHDSDPSTKDHAHPHRCPIGSTRTQQPYAARDAAPQARQMKMNSRHVEIEVLRCWRWPHPRRAWQQRDQDTTEPAHVAPRQPFSSAHPRRCPCCAHR